MNPGVGSHPTLAVIAGPLLGSEFKLDRDELSIGRDAANDIRIDDPSVSRRHCTLQIQAGRTTLRDLQSRNGTLINGLKVEEHVLTNRDQVRIGNTVMLFLLAGQKAATEVTLAEPSMTRTIMLRPEDSIYFGRGNDTAAASGDLRALLEFSRRIAAAPTLGAFRETIEHWIRQNIPCDQVLTALAPAAEELIRENPAVQPAIEERAAILIADGAAAIPLLSRGGSHGAIHLSRAGKFTDREFQMAAAAGAVASLALENLNRLQDLESANDLLREEIRVQHNIVGHSAKMKPVFERIAKSAQADSTVLIRGESGTGKELVARAIHNSSVRAKRPFIAINCAALPETLLESELFGYERGAFTGAVNAKPGKLELADTGTVFLDEIGEMSAALQSKLLRVIQEKKFERLGATRTTQVNIRLIAATNRDLEAAMKKSEFRTDLFYRLNVVTISLPSLRDRRDDILPLADYFRDKYAREAKRQVGRISADARESLLHHDWPGNVRELENAIERAVVLGSSEEILREDLPETVLESSIASVSGSRGFHDQVLESKKKIILSALERSAGSQVDASRLLDLHPTYLNRLMRQFRLREGMKA